VNQNSVFLKTLRVDCRRKKKKKPSICWVKVSGVSGVCVRLRSPLRDWQLNERRREDCRQQRGEALTIATHFFKICIRLPCGVMCAGIRWLSETRHIFLHQSHEPQ
jgi:hypothetical protein